MPLHARCRGGSTKAWLFHPSFDLRLTVTSLSVRDSLTLPVTLGLPPVQDNFKFGTCVLCGHDSTRQLPVVYAPSKYLSFVHPHKSVAHGDEPMSFRHHDTPIDAPSVGIRSVSPIEAFEGSSCVSSFECLSYRKIGLPIYIRKFS
jgi:hypothetical protein